VNQPLVLSLFPGIGLLDMAFELEGFCVVRGPDVLWGGDVHRFHPPAGVFDGVIGGPPCQAFSRLANLVRANGYTVAENLIPEYERVVSEALPAWFLMENVEGAPVPQVRHFWPARTLVLNNRWCGAEQNRRRRFSFGMRSDAPVVGLDVSPDLVLLESIDSAPAVMANGGSRTVPVLLGGSGKVKASKARDIGYVSRRYLTEAVRLQGLPDGFLDDAPFTQAGKVKVIGNGVPLPMGRVIARAVRRAMGYAEEDR
jgi:DNA (cytosine-5)-methyltransferase 1